MPLLDCSIKILANKRVWDRELGSDGLEPDWERVWSNILGSTIVPNPCLCLHDDDSSLSLTLNQCRPYRSKKEHTDNMVSLQTSID